MEDELIIFTAQRSPMREPPIGTDSLLDTLRDFYVMATRARCDLIIFDSMKYLQVLCQNWEASINHFGATQNS